MLAFLHAGAVGQPLKQAVVGLDFFGFNMFFPRNREQLEARFAGSGSEAFADFLATELANRPRDDKAAMPADPRVTEPVRRTHAPVQPAAETPEPEAWSEAVYLAIHPDVAAAVARKDFKSGREHYELAGRAEGRETGMSPNDWSEALYLSIYPDVAAEVRRGTFASGYHHYLMAGRAEGRDSGVPPSGNTWPPIPPPAPASRWANIKPATRTTPPWDGSKDCWEDYPPPIPWKDCGCTGRS